MSESNEANKTLDKLIENMEEIAGKGKVLSTRNLFLELVDFLYETIYEKIDTSAERNLEKNFTAKMKEVLADNLNDTEKITLFVKKLNADGKQKEWLNKFGKSFVDGAVKKCKNIKTDSKTGNQVAKQVMKILTLQYQTYTTWNIWNQISGYWGNFKKYCMGQDKNFVDEIVDKGNEAINKVQSVIKAKSKN